MGVWEPDNGNWRMRNGSMENWRMRNGSMENWRMRNGRMENWSMRNGSMENWRMRNGSMGTGVLEWEYESKGKVKVFLPEGTDA